MRDEKDIESTAKPDVVKEEYRNIYLTGPAETQVPPGGGRELHCEQCFTGTDMSTIKLGEKDLVLKSLSGINNIIAHGSK